MMRAAWAVSACALLVSCGGDGGANSLPAVAIEPLAGGDTELLSDVEGPAVINLWATTCPPCVREIPEFEAVHRERADVAFVGINIGEDAERAAAFLADLDVTYDQYLDPQGYVVTGLETTAMPVTIVIDAAGEISTRHVGAMDQDDLRAAIDRAVDG